MRELELLAENSELKKQLADLIKKSAEADQIMFGLIAVVEAVTEVARCAMLAAADADPNFNTKAKEAIARGETVLALVAAGRAEAALHNAPSSETIN